MYSMAILDKLFALSIGLCLCYSQRELDCIQSMFVMHVKSKTRNRIIVTCIGSTQSYLSRLTNGGSMFIERLEGREANPVATLSHKNEVGKKRDNVEAHGRFKEFFEVIIKNPTCQDFGAYRCRVDSTLAYCSMTYPYLTDDDCIPARNKTKQRKPRRTTQENSRMTSAPVTKASKDEAATERSTQDEREDEPSCVPSYALIISVFLAVLLAVAAVIGLLLAGGTKLKCPGRSCRTSKQDHTYATATRDAPLDDENYTALTVTSPVYVNTLQREEVNSSTTNGRPLYPAINGSDVTQASGQSDNVRYSLGTNHYEKMG